MYPLADIEVCGWKIGRFPQLHAFVKSDRVKEWSGLRVRYVRGADPVIKLLDEEGEPQESLNIEKWDTDTITEFLTERLEK